ncbi:MAG: hypothetical protein HYR55_13515 [Acidobacteria bacterium]|nr:hypothetical protein [Acidobacteriota bacterium]
MASQLFTESIVEQATLAWLQSLGDAVQHGPDIARANPDRRDPNYRKVVLESEFVNRGCGRRYCWAGGKTEYEKKGRRRGW